MILKKIFYRPIFYPLSLGKSFLFVTKQIWTSLSRGGDLPFWSRREDYRDTPGRGRPSLSLRSRVVAGDWEKTQEVCPTHCLQVQTDKGKLVSLWLERERCTHCGLCAEVAPGGAIELIPTWRETSFAVSTFDLVEERERLNP